MSSFNDFLSEEILKEIIEEFLESFQERIDSLNINLLNIEKSPKNIESVREFYKTLHNIKGTAATLGFNELSVVAHRMEDIVYANFDTPELILNKIDFLYKQIDRMNKLIESYKYL